MPSKMAFTALAASCHFPAIKPFLPNFQEGPLRLLLMELGYTFPSQPGLKTYSRENTKHPLCTNTDTAHVFSHF